MTPSPASGLSRELVLQALRSPRGRYEAERASQLSGIPKSTIYDWRRAGVFAPDFAGANPMAWSYRDLIYLRLLAWLRGRGMDRPYASDLVLAIRQEIQSGDRVDKIRTDGRIILRDQEAISRYSGENVFPLDEVLAMFSEFDLLEPIKELGDRPLWGPNLVNPSAFTFISPWVMAGEPCVNESRIATSSLYALHTERGLSAESVVRLYPSLDSEAVSDAWNLERRLRRAA